MADNFPSGSEEINDDVQTNQETAGGGDLDKRVRLLELKMAGLVGIEGRVAALEGIPTGTIILDECGRKVIEECWDILVRDMSYEDLQDDLFSKGLLKLEDTENIAHRTTTTEKNQMLLLILLRRMKTVEPLETALKEQHLHLHQTMVACRVQLASGGPNTVDGPCQVIDSSSDMAMKELCVRPKTTSTFSGRQCEVQPKCARTGNLGLHSRDNSSGTAYRQDAPSAQGSQANPGISIQGDNNIVVVNSSNVSGTINSNAKGQKQDTNKTSDELPEVIGSIISHLKNHYSRKALTSLAIPWAERPTPVNLANYFTTLMLINKKDADLERQKAHSEGRDANFDRQYSRAIEMQEIFCGHKDCDDPLTVLIEGDAGIGKSTLCQKMIYDWAKGNQDNAYFIHEFELVFLVEARSMLDTIQATLRQLCSKLMDQDCFDAVWKWMRSNREKILLIVDGLDELKTGEQRENIRTFVEDNMYSQWHLLLTSRTNQANFLLGDCGTKSPVDTELMDIGFSPQQAELYFRAYFEGKPRDEESMLDFLQESPEVLGDLTRTPVNCFLLCLWWESEHRQRHNPKSLTQTQLYDSVTNSLLRLFCVRSNVKLVEQKVPENIQGEYETLQLLALAGVLCKVYQYTPEQMKAYGISVDSQATKLGYLKKECRNVSLFDQEQYYSFLHRSIQEFLAAQYFALCDRSTQMAILQLLKDTSQPQLLKFLYGLCSDDQVLMSIIRAVCMVRDKRCSKLLSVYATLVSEKLMKPLCEEEYQKAITCANMSHLCNTCQQMLRGKALALSPMGVQIREDLPLALRDKYGLDSAPVRQLVRDDMPELDGSWTLLPLCTNCIQRLHKTEKRRETTDLAEDSDCLSKSGFKPLVECLSQNADQMPSDVRAWFQRVVRGNLQSIEDLSDGHLLFVANLVTSNGIHDFWMKYIITIPSRISELWLEAYRKLLNTVGCRVSESITVRSGSINSLVKALITLKDTKVCSNVKHLSVYLIAATDEPDQVEFGSGSGLSGSFPQLERLDLADADLDRCIRSFIELQDKLLGGRELTVGLTFRRISCSETWLLWNQGDRRFKALYLTLATPGFYLSSKQRTELNEILKLCKLMLPKTATRLVLSQFWLHGDDVVTRLQELEQESTLQDKVFEMRSIHVSGIKTWRSLKWCLSRELPGDVYAECDNLDLSKKNCQDVADLRSLDFSRVCHGLVLLTDILHKRQRKTERADVAFGELWGAEEWRDFKDHLLPCLTQRQHDGKRTTLIFPSRYMKEMTKAYWVAEKIPTNQFTNDYVIWKLVSLPHFEACQHEHEVWVNI